MKLRALLATLTLLGTLALGSGLEASAATQPEVACGDNYTSAVLSHDLTCSTLSVSNGRGNTIDLRGHTLTVTDLFYFQDDAGSILNGKIISPRVVGIGTVTLNRVTVTGRLATGTSFYIDRIPYTAWRVIHSRVNGDVGAAGNLTIDRSVITGSVSILAEQQRSSNYNVTKSNIGNGFGVISYVTEAGGLPLAIIHGNIAYNKIAGGISVSSNVYDRPSFMPFGGMTITGNVFTNGLGINIVANAPQSTDLVLKGNRVKDGGVIYVTGAPFADGGGNKAPGSYPYPQCIGVAC